MKRLIMIVMLVAAVAFGAKAGDNDWAVGITATKSVKAASQEELERPYWSLGGEISRRFNPVWRLTITPELKLQYLEYRYHNERYSFKNSGFALTLGVDFGIRLGRGFSVLTGPAVRYGTNTADESYGDKAFVAYWDFGVRKDFSKFFITAKYYQSFIRTKPHLLYTYPGIEYPEEPDLLHQNNLSLSIGYRF